MNSQDVLRLFVTTESETVSMTYMENGIDYADVTGFALYILYCTFYMKILTIFDV